MLFFSGLYRVISLTLFINSSARDDGNPNNDR